MKIHVTSAQCEFMAKLEEQHDVIVVGGQYLDVKTAPLSMMPISAESLSNTLWSKLGLQVAYIPMKVKKGPGKGRFKMRIAYR